MRKSIFAAMALALTAGTAVAADLPHYKAPLPPPPPPPLWTGFYVGLNAGYTWSNSNNVTLGAFSGAFNPNQGNAAAFAANYALLASGTFRGNSDGFIGGGQIGYNWQFYNSFVAGVEADIQGVAGSSSRRGFATALGDQFGNTITSAVSVSKSLDYLGTVRGRLGWLFTPTLLIYGTGGLAYGGVNTSASISQFITNPFLGPAFGSGSFSDTRVGWTAGGGVEWMFWPNWSAKVEYLYYDLGTVSYSAGVLAPALQVVPGSPNPLFANFHEARTRFNGNIVRAGLNYHFNWGAPPVVAKY
ncbi:outer membrane protein [Methylocystis sp. 9N]|uniref:Outer membrane protein n=1 Tax=Methylocystis borbori TaxID=3118750 RepID=A0ABU7XEQ4_9HYPH